MKKLRPFLALLLACWLLALPALADDEAGGAPDDAPSVSDDVGDRDPSPSEETSAPSEDPPASEDIPSEREDPPDTSDDTPSFPDDTPSSSEDTPPVVDDTPDTPDPDPADPDPVTPDPIDPDPVDPAPVDPDPVDPAPADPVPEVPESVPDVPAVVPETPVDPPLTYPIPDASAVVPGLQGTSGEIYELGVSTAPAVEEHQIFTITTIPEFALALLDTDADNTMSQVIRDLFGTYTPRIQTVTTYMDGEQIAIEEQYVPGVAGMDWEWIAGFTLFLLLIYCLFRLLGGAVKYG